MVDERKKATTKRIGRASLALLLAGTVAHVTGEPAWLGLGPVLQGAGKWLRECFGLKNLPF